MTPRDQLAAIHPALPALSIAVAVGGLVWLWRTYHARSFEALPKPVQALPALLLSALAAAAANGLDPIPVVVDAVSAALLAVGGHHTLAKHVLPQPKIPPPSALCLLAMLSAGLSASACGGNSLPADVARDAKCAGIRAMYDDAQTRLIERGACDHVDSVTACLPHVALREALVMSLERAECH